jgi:spore coat polysaccharide biosynthesis predicted glycosyltransferase SpsG
MDRIDQWSDSVRVLETSPGSREDATRTTTIAADCDAEWVVVDGPHFDADYLELVNRGSSNVLLVDDMGERDHYGTDLVLNQNLHADEAMYADRESDTELLLGPDYALFRNEFLDWLDWSPDATNEPETLLVTLGGSDPDDATGTVVEALDRVGADLETQVIVGAANDSLPDLIDLAEDVDQPICFEQNVTDMATQMARADLAVSSGGTTCWELAYMGVPTVVGTIAPVEKYLVTGLQDIRLFSHVGDFASASSTKIATLITRLIKDESYRVGMSNHGQDIIDGYGRQRTIGAMRDY